MDYDWSLFQSPTVKQDEVAESFEDPFSLRFLPDDGEIARQSRFICMGKTLADRGVFSIYSSNGKLIKVVTARPMTDEESFFYQRKTTEAL
jgi:uncharacterized DUF497 family protein